MSWHNGMCGWIQLMSDHTFPAGQSCHEDSPVSDSLSTIITFSLLWFGAVFPSVCAVAPFCIQL